jgi:hypothetical protein
MIDVAASDSVAKNTERGKTHISHFVIAIGVILVLVVAVAASISAWMLRQEVEKQWSEQLNNLSLILAEKTSQEIGIAYFILSSIEEEVKKAEIKNLDELRDKMLGQKMNKMLSAWLTKQPQIEVAAILGANGDVVNSSRLFPVSKINLADQAYFKKHRDDPDLAVYINKPINKPILDEGSRKWTFYLSRRLNDEDGAFIGVALVGVSSSFFSDFFKKISLGEGASISLYHRDFTLLARWPHLDNMMGKANRSGSSYTIIEERKQSYGTLLTESPRFSDSGRIVSRMGASRLVEKYPFIVNLTITEDLFLADWYRVVKTLGAFAIGSMLTLGAAFFYLAKLLTRREEDMAATLLLKQQAEAASRAKSEFLTMMSHEIRTPLTSIIGYAELMCDSPDGLSADEAAQAILRNGRHLLRIINDILDLSKIEAGRLQLEKIGFSPLDVIWNLDSMIGAQAHGKGIEFNTVVTYPMPSKIVGDPTRWKQILLNLYGNAVKFTELGAVNATLSYHPERSVMTCTVSDSGIGMNEAQITSLFKPFSQADSTITRKYGGTGLGLNLVRQLAERMQGKVSVSSKMGQGSVFTIEILAPVDEDAQWLTKANTMTLESIQSATKLPENLHGRVLLAEDSPDNRRLVGTCLRRLGIDFSFAENGEEAVQLAMNEEFDVILMDMQMPVMDGLTATEILRATGYGGPIVAFTANVMSEDIERYLAKGCSHCVGKPIDFTEFTRLLAELLGDKSNPSKALASPMTAFDLPEFQLLKASYEASFYARLMALKACVTGGDWVEAERLAHILKGSGGTYGYPEVSQIAHSLEQHIRAGEAEEAVIAMEQLLTLDVLQKFLSVGAT